MSRWPAYPAYKDSGVEWLGEIPAHWEMRRLKYALSRNDGGVWGDDAEEDGVIVLRSTDMTVDGEWKIEDPALRELSESEYESARLRAGDLLVTKSSGSALHLGKTALVTNAVEELDCCYSNFMQRLRTRPVLMSSYLYRMLNSPLGREQFNYFGSTTTGLANLNSEVIGNVLVPLPTFSEQRTIAAFLDRETAKLDALTHKFEQLLDRLEEQRAALISHAVTKGATHLRHAVEDRLPSSENAPLEGDRPSEVCCTSVEMQDSGIEWLGEIPAHWEIGRVKYLANVQRGKFSHRPRNDPDFYDGDYPFIQTGDITDASKYILGYQQTLNERGFSVSKLFPKGTLVMSIAANIGNLAILKFDACFPDSIVGIVPHTDIDKIFLYYSLVAMEEQMLTVATQNTQFNLNVEQIGQVWVTVPPHPEQRAIAAYLDRETAKIDALADRVHAALDRLAEYRTALISAAVTGKIDVRGGKVQRTSQGGVES